MGKIKNAINIATSCTLIGVTALLGYGVYKYSGIFDFEANQERKEIRERVSKEMNKKGLEGVMWHELKERIPKAKLNSYNFDFDNAEIVKTYYNKEDDRLVVFIRDIHKLENIQENLYQTIDELHKENGVDLLILEGCLPRELTRESIKSNISILSKIYWRICHKFWVPETESQAKKAFSAGCAYEYVNDSEIKTYGLEDKDIHDAAGYILMTGPRSEGEVWLFENVVLDKRSEIGVERTLEYMKKTGEKEAMLVFGAGHTKKILECLENEGVSYVVVQPKGVDAELEKLFLETIQGHKNFTNQ